MHNLQDIDLMNQYRVRIHNKLKVSRGVKSSASNYADNMMRQSMNLHLVNVEKIRNFKYSLIDLM